MEEDMYVEKVDEEMRSNEVWFNQENLDFFFR